MPWKVSDVYDERVRFVAGLLRGDVCHAAACAAFGISRETGYKWLARYRTGGWDGLRDGSRARHSQSQAMALSISRAVLELRRLRPSWGPKKLRAYLAREQPAVSWPAASTIGDLLRREGLVSGRPQRRTLPMAKPPFGAVVAPNDLWCVDFKGWFRTRDGQRCDPLTVSDALSRYLLVCAIVSPTTAGVAPTFERLFREHGLPVALRMDNGAPFASATSAGGLTRLSVGWVKLGIGLERIEPGCPQQNGRHERMHRTLKADTSSPPAATAQEQQQRFDLFRRDFNEERPHEALGQATPASRHATSLRAYPDRIEEPWYDADHEVRRVRSDGTIKWRGEYVFVCEALAGEPIGLVEMPDGSWNARFADIPLGLIDAAGKKFRRFAAPRPGRREPATTRESVSHVPGP